MDKQDIFGTQKKRPIEVAEPTENIKKDEIIQIDTNKLVAYRGEHPFSFYSENDYNQLKESISKVGILVPIIVRKVEDDKYEIFSGHHRVKVAMELGINPIPAIVKNVDNDHAVLIMTDTNLCQREDIPLSEKGRAYKLRLEAIKRIREKGGAPMEHQKSVENLAGESKDSRPTIQRLIRITELIEPLQQKVNQLEQISLRAGVELSYLSHDEQSLLNEFIDENKLKISIEQAENIRAMRDNISKETLAELFRPKEKEHVVKYTGKLNKDIINKYRPRFNSDDEFSQLVDHLLEKHFKQSMVVPS